MRHRGLQTELLWRSLRRGESCAIVSFVDAPVAIVEQFLSFGWNVLPFLESGDLHIVDCFTNRLSEKHQVPEKQTDWNAYINTFLDDVVATVRDPTELREVERKLYDAVESFDEISAGIVVIDSINEASPKGREFRTEQFIEEIRAVICSRLFVPIFTSTTITKEAEFSRNKAYIFDGIIDMQHNERILPSVRLKQISIRKLDGVGYRPDWIAYENAGYRGFVAYDPHTEFNRVYPL